MTVDGSHETLPPRRDSRRPMGPMFTVRALQVLLWLVVISGPAAAVLVAMEVSALGGRLDAVSDQAAVVLPPDTTGVEGFAELFVAAFLGVGEDSPETLALFLDDPPLDGVADGSWFATRTTSLGAREISPGYFAVTVAAEVVAAGPEPGTPAVWVPVGTRFYSVGVVETDTGWAVTGLPALVAAPTRTVAPELLIRRLDGLDATSGLEEMVRRFLAAYLAGDGELARYVAPSLRIVAIRPPPFTTVDVARAGSIDTSDGSQLVAVVVEATDAEGRGQVLEYALVVEERDGRWEVSELLPAPPLAP